MKDGYAVVHNEKRKKKKSVSHWLGPNVKGNGLPLIARCTVMDVSLLGRGGSGSCQNDGQKVKRGDL